MLAIIVYAYSGEENMKKLSLWMQCIYYFVLGNVFVIFKYDKKYIQGRWFCGRLGGMLSDGWKWVVKDTIMNKKLGTNKDVPWPVSPQCRVVCPENISFDVNDLNNFHSFGIYYQANGKIEIGKGTYIGPNVGIITANHNPDNLDSHLEPKPVVIGENCWIGMNCVVLPGVILGNNTIVGAGSVVTKSFLEGNCVIAGNPARIIK